MDKAKSNGIIIYGSSRSKGNTYEIGKRIASRTGATLTDLNDFEITPYDYNHDNQTDDFLSLAEHMTNCGVVVLISPVYWYTMSAQMKTFIDRWSDLVTIRKDLGRKLKGVRLVVVSCGNDDNPGEGFELPFCQTADYLDMEFEGYFHVWKEDHKEIDIKVVDIISQISSKISENLQRPPAK